MKIKRNNSSALRRRSTPGGFSPLPTDEPRSPIKRNYRKTKIFIAVSSDVQNKRFTAFQGMIARGLCVTLGNKANKGGR